MADTPNDDGKVDEESGQTQLGEPSEELLARTADRLEAFRTGLTGRDAEDVQPTVDPPAEDDEKPKDGEKSEDDRKSEDDEKPKDDEKPQDDESDDDKKSEADADGDKDADDEPSASTLPAAYRRSLKAYDWTDEEIDAAVTSAPAKFLVTAERIHRNRNAETAQFADLGRKAREAATTPPAAPQPATATTPPVVEPGGLKLINTEDLIERFGGNEELVNGLVGPVNETIQQINSVLPELRSNIQTVKRAREDTLATQIEGFFTSADMKVFTDFYGNLGETPLTADQQGHRNDVLEMADAIVAGASMQGRRLSVDDALLAAHDSVASEQVASQVRAKIKKGTMKRAKGVTLKPSGGGKSKSGSKPTTRGQLEDKVREKLGRVFG